MAFASISTVPGTAIGLKEPAADGTAIASSTWRPGLALVLVWLVGAISPGAASAAIITVSGACSLPEAIEAANNDSTGGGDCTQGDGADTIRLTASINLTVLNNTLDGPNGLPSITSAITVEGNGYSIVHLSAEDFRIFHVGTSGDLTLDDVVVAFGSAPNGGGIYNLGQLSVRGSRIWANSAQYGGGIYNGGHALIELTEIEDNIVTGWRTSGGGIASESVAGSSPVLEIDSSTINSNTASSSEGAGDALGGGVFADDGHLVVAASTFGSNLVEGYDFVGGGAIWADTVTITNSTFSGNEAKALMPENEYDGGQGGAVGATSGTLANVTLYGNTAVWGAALFSYDGLTVSGSLLRDNTSTLDAPCWGGISGSGNKANTDLCPPIPDGLFGLDPNLASNGGPTQTHKLFDFSNALGLAGSCGLGTDQRGAGRSGPCDAGAFEELGCVLFEMSNQEINVPVVHSACHSALMGPDLVILPTGSLDLSAGYLITVFDGFEVHEGALLRFIAGP